VGFFEQRPTENGTHWVYWVPPLYRPALEMVQGAADGVRDRIGGSGDLADED